VLLPSILFFLQAEDGIRHRNVTGVQTCALPILPRTTRSLYAADARDSSLHRNRVPSETACAPRSRAAATPRPSAIPPAAMTGSEIGRASCRESVMGSAVEV